MSIFIREHIGQLRTLIANLAAEYRKTTRDHERIAYLRHQIKAYKTEDYIRAVRESAPPLSQETRERLAALLSSPQGADAT